LYYFCIIYYIMNKNNLSEKESELIRHLRNYLAHTGRFPTIRQMKDTMGYVSPRSISILLARLMDKGYVKKNDQNKYELCDYVPGQEENAQTIDVPLVGAIACGLPVLAEENIEMMIPVSTKLAKPLHKYFLLKAKGDSMNQADIQEGDLVLVQQQNTASNGDIVTALIDDEATLKRFYFTGDVIVLKPDSSNAIHKPIILTRDFLIQGIVVKKIPGF